MFLIFLSGSSSCLRTFPHHCAGQYPGECLRRALCSSPAQSSVWYCPTLSLTSLSQGIYWASPGYPSLLCALESLKTMSWGNCRALLIFSSSLRDRYSSLSDVLCLKNYGFIYLSIFFFTVSAAVVNSAPDIVSWSEGDI